MNKSIIELSKSPTILLKELNSYIRKRMIIISGLCSALFDGRIKSRLEESDRLLIIKPDETIILHNPYGVKPIQWQRPNVGRIKFNLNDNMIEMETYRPKTDESFFITFKKIYHVFVYYAKVTSETPEIIGHEKDFVQHLIENPQLIEEGFKVLEHEKITEVGSIDIFGVDTSGNHVIIEVKKQSASPADAHQLKRYFDHYCESNDITSVRGILIASSVPKKVKKQLNMYSLEFHVIPWQKIFPTLKRPLTTTRTRNLEEFL